MVKNRRTKTRVPFAGSRHLLRFVLPLVLIAAGGVHSVVVYTDISTRELTIGDRVKFTVSVVVPPESRVVPPETENGFGPFVVKDWREERSSLKNADSVSFEYIITTYEVKQCSIPSLPFLLPSSDVPDTVYSDTIPMLVRSVIDTDSAALRDIKAPLSAGKPSLWWLWTIIALVTAVGLVFLIRYLVMKSPTSQRITPSKPPLEEAMDALKQLDAKQLIEQGLFREYVFEISEILKRYIGRRYECNAAEFTTDEILDWLRDTSLVPNESKDSGIWFFKTTHPVKFAGVVPDRTTLNHLREQTVGFLRQTRPRPEPEKAEDRSAQASAEQPEGATQ
jgi:hypothetical protein